MESVTPKLGKPEKILLIITACSAALLIVVALLCIPYYGKSQEPISAHLPPVQTEEPTEPTEEPTEESTGPTLPPPEANPYGRNDFQYNENNYLSCLAGESSNGIDVSAYQGEVDWEKVAASGIDFAMVRAGYRGYGEKGTLVEDKYAKDNLEGAIAAGLDVGVYFFSQALNTQEVEEEVAFLLEIIEGYELTMPVVYDWEYISEEARTANMDARTLTDCSLHFCKLIEEAGYTPMVYFNTNQARDLLYLPELKEYDFWLAWYSDRMRFPYKLKMWQYTCYGRVPGIEGDVDINILFHYD